MSFASIRTFVLLLALPIADGALTVYLTLWFGARPVLIAIVTSAGLGVVGDYYCWTRFRRTARSRRMNCNDDFNWASEIPVLFLALLMFAAPGLLTDVVGFALLTPPIRRRAASRFRRMNAAAEDAWMRKKRKRTKNAPRLMD